MKKVLTIVLVVALIASLAVVFAACNITITIPSEIELPEYDIEAPDYSSLQIPANFKSAGGKFKIIGFFTPIAKASLFIKSSQV